MKKSSSSHEMVGLEEISLLRKKLAIILRFHHYEVLHKLPLEIAARAMTEAWDTPFYPEIVALYCSGASTAIIPPKRDCKPI